MIVGCGCFQFASTHLHTWAERGTVRVKCLAQAQNIMSPSRARSQITRSWPESSAITMKPPRNFSFLFGGSFIDRVTSKIPSRIYLHFFFVFMNLNIHVCISQRQH